MEEGLAALIEAGRRLRELDQERFARVLALALAYVAAYDSPEEGEREVLARCLRISPGNPKASA